jgi:predicted RNase H-like nuclease (RuvC/YqgF family)
MAVRRTVVKSHPFSRSRAECRKYLSFRSTISQLEQENSQLHDALEEMSQSLSTYRAWAVSCRKNESRLEGGDSRGGRCK